MRARMLVDAKIVRADPEHPLAVYEAGQEIEGPAAELQVALGHAQALPEPLAIVEAAPEAKPELEAEPEGTREALKESRAAEAPAVARAED